MFVCAPQAELEQARAEAEKARAEAEKTRAETEELRAKANAEERAKTEAAKQKEAQEKAMAEAMKRWNAAVGGVTVPAPMFGQVNFAWPELYKFPHPTFKGGSAEAYGAFAAVLLVFLQNDDNFNYLAKNKLFTADLRYGFPNGTGTMWTFAGLTEQLSAPRRAQQP